MKNFKKIMILILIILLIIVFYILFNPFVSKYTIEAGTKIEISNLLKRDIKNAHFSQSFNIHQLNNVGKYDVDVEANCIPYKVQVNVEDTIAPKATIKKQNMWIGDNIISDLFVSDIKDASPVKTSFKKQPDFEKQGTQDITIVLKDISGNTTEYNTTLTLKKDVEAPVISCVNTILSNKGETIPYKKDTKVTDNRDKEVTLNVDSSEVNYNEPGTYYAIYSAIDQSGNKAEKKVKVIILNNNDASLKEEAKNKAKLLIDKITKGKKTKQDQLEVCFQYIRTHITYNGKHSGDADHYYIDALNGLKTWRGDCLVSNGILRVICESLDIPTIVVERNTVGRSHHYWILADTGDGWYHYDAYNQYNNIYKWTDEQLLTWSKQNNHYQDFDRNKYPSTPNK